MTEFSCLGGVSLKEFSLLQSILGVWLWFWPSRWFHGLSLPLSWVSGALEVSCLHYYWNYI